MKIQRMSAGSSLQQGPNSEITAASNRLLSAEDVAQLTGLSVETLAQWRSQRRGIPYVKISRNCVRYRKCDLDSWLVERTVLTDQGGSDRR
jgi:predicted DNA-binding transcriptional regulator AlpA